MTLALLLALGCTADPRRTMDSGSPVTEVAPQPDPSWPSLPGLEADIAASLESARVPGAQVAIVRDGEVAWASSFGVRDTDTGEPVTADSPFAQASVSKTVMAVALLQVHESGAFGLDDPIGPYLAFTVDHPKSRVPITFRHLLTHTAGIKDNWSVLDEGYGPGDPVEPLEAFLERVLDPKGADYSVNRGFHAWGPGEGYDYSNVGSALAGHLVEAVTGVDFDVWCQQHIFTPLAMQDTAWKLAGLDVSRVAHPHRCGGAEGCRPLAHYGYPDYPDGLLRSTASDMGRFLAAVTRGGELEGTRILSETMVAEMLRPQAKDGQALAWYESSIAGQTVVGHSGADPGVSTEMFSRRRDGTGFVLLMNAEPMAWRHVVDIETALLDAADAL